MTALARVAQRAPARKPAAPRRGAVLRPTVPARKGSAPGGARRGNEASPPRRQPTASRAPKRVAVQRSTVIFVIVTGVVVVGIMLGLVALNALLAQASFRIGDLQSRVATLTQSYQERRLEVAELASPSHLASVAAHFGLTAPQGGVVVLTPTDGTPGKAVGGRR